MKHKNPICAKYFIYIQTIVHSEQIVKIPLVLGLPHTLTLIILLLRFSQTREL